MVEFLSNIVQIVLFVLLVVGLMQCRKNSFMYGFIFFLILIISRLYSYTSQFFVRSYIDSGNVPPMGLSLGELFVWDSLIPRILEAIAFGILVFGLYRMWKHNTQKS